MVKVVSGRPWRHEFSNYCWRPSWIRARAGVFQNLPYYCAHWLIFIVKADISQFMQCFNEWEQTIWQFIIVNVIDISFSSVCPVIDNEFRYNIVKVVCGSTWLTPHGSTATWTMLWWNFVIGTDAWKTAFNLWNSQNSFELCLKLTISCMRQKISWI